MSTTKTERTWEKLVWAETNCSGCNGTGSYQMFDRPEPGFGRTCGRCGGTGKAPLLPMLRESCRALHNRITANNISTATHAEVGCSGWQAKPIDGFLLLSEMRKAEFRWDASNYGWIFDPIGTDALDSPDATIVQNGNDLAACVEAAWKAVEARHPQKEKQ